MMPLALKIQARYFILIESRHVYPINVRYRVKASYPVQHYLLDDIFYIDYYSTLSLYYNWYIKRHFLKHHSYHLKSELFKTNPEFFI
jgi:hypothetical protein